MGQTDRRDRDRVAVTETVPGWPAIVARGLHQRFGDHVAVGSLDLDVPTGSFCGAFSKRTTSWPARARKIAAAGPAVPEPTMAMRSAADIYAFAFSQVKLRSHSPF